MYVPGKPVRVKCDVLGVCVNTVSVPGAMTNVSEFRLNLVYVCLPLPFIPLIFSVRYSALCTSHGGSLFECVMLL